jgi:hypothetical protein
MVKFPYVGGILTEFDKILERAMPPLISPNLDGMEVTLIVGGL